MEGIIEGTAHTFRPVTEDDKPFIRDLYATTREFELAQVPWTDEQKAAFIDMQFNAQWMFYAEKYAGGEHVVVECDGAAVGRLFTHRNGTEIRIVDITIRPDFRNRGIGSSIIAGLLAEASRTDGFVSIHVETFNPSLALFARFGFEEVETNGFLVLLRSRGEGASG